MPRPSKECVGKAADFPAGSFIFGIDTIALAKEGSTSDKVKGGVTGANTDKSPASNMAVLADAALGMSLRLPAHETDRGAEKKKSAVINKKRHTPFTRPGSGWAYGPGDHLREVKSGRVVKVVLGPENTHVLPTVKLPLLSHVELCCQLPLLATSKPDWPARDPKLHGMKGAIVFNLGCTNLLNVVSTWRFMRDSRHLEAILFVRISHAMTEDERQKVLCLKDNEGNLVFRFCVFARQKEGITIVLHVY